MTLSGATIASITMHSDPKGWLKLTKFKADVIPQGVQPITNPAFIKIDLAADSDKTKYLLVPAPDVEKWLKMLNASRLSKTGGDNAQRPSNPAASSGISAPTSNPMSPRSENTKSVMFSASPVVTTGTYSSTIFLASSSLC